ncbi:transposase [Larkinella rosea]|uniref:Transposase n=1 Tax=Larkinella rosea TaxID=2025312 RepID=A0A3P1C7S7_9BACT|nr:transposase [Larkinella rosea]RRB09352.1 transposase [Larkinella rosea]
MSVQRKSVHSLQLIVEAIFYLTKNGITWRDLLQGRKPWQTVDWYFRKWSHNDTWSVIEKGGHLLGLRVGKKPGFDSLPTSEQNGFFLWGRRVGAVDAEQVRRRGQVPLCIYLLLANIQSTKSRS